ncbi:MAG: septal ring lytic transglycosylase RlpA family protein [Rhodospirillales bacterium]|nr:septal ring lytic transglycosylase RlpA family protein [Rhodospirillales bacterium]
MTWAMRGVESIRWAALASGLLILSACAETQFVLHTAKKVSKATEQQGLYKVGQPYQVDGVWYYPAEDFDYDETGIASWYGSDFHGKATANGEVYDMNALTAAHKALPMPSFVRVTNLDNGRSIVLRVNDRGPFVRGRIIDVSRRGSQLLGFEQAGTARVRVQILADESRAIAAKLKGETVAMQGNGPIKNNERHAKPQVSSESLPPPKGASAPAASPGHAPRDLAPKAVPVWADAATDRVSTVANPVSGVVSQQPIRPTTLFIQAGAFGQYDNAQRVRTALAHAGSVRVSEILVNGRGLYRVRVGPFANLEDADRTLNSVMQAGYPDAKIIVD